MRVGDSEFATATVAENQTEAEAQERPVQCLAAATILSPLRACPFFRSSLRTLLLATKTVATFIPSAERFPPD